MRPMSFSLFITKALWILPLALQFAIALVMLRRQLVKSFPVFFSYTVLVFSEGIALLFLKPNTNRFALIYWCTEALAVLLGLAVIFEILRHILPPYSSLRFVLNFVWALAGLSAVTALLILILAKPGTGEPIYEVVMLGERSVRFLQASLLIVVIVLMSRLGLSWRQQSVGIAAGFGLYSALALAGFELGGHLHVISAHTLALLNSAAYNLATIIWAFYILRPARVTPVEHLPKADLAEWNSAVTDYVNQWSRRY
jgi:hypothetical protein